MGLPPEEARGELERTHLLVSHLASEIDALGQAQERYRRECEEQHLEAQKLRQELSALQVGMGGGGHGGRPNAGCAQHLAHLRAPDPLHTSIGGVAPLAARINHVTRMYQPTRLQRRVPLLGCHAPRRPGSARPSDKPPSPTPLGGQCGAGAPRGEGEGDPRARAGGQGAPPAGD
eukprot:scaffold5843_cov125-Isochrysis_galbana.AAC.7